MTRAYYNENDPFAAQWLRNLIAAGLIANGDVDDRSIRDVRPSDLRGYSQCHFFAGIGGWSLALRMAGLPDSFECWTGSCPCQPFRSAGKQRGVADDRHLWPVWFPLIRECRPSVVFGEQVASAIGHGWLDTVATDLEGESYAFGAAVLPATSEGAFHKRDRLWFVADARSGRFSGTGGGEMEFSGRAEVIGASGTLADATRIKFRGLAPAGHERGNGELDFALADRERRARFKRRPRDASQIERGRELDRGRGVGDLRTASALGYAGGAGLPPPEREDVAGAHGPQFRRTVEQSSHSFWAGAKPVQCGDGKTRYVEPGISLLAHGVSGRVAISVPAGQSGPENETHWYNRVGSLKGFGNAIVPQVAAAFIEAALADA